MDRDGWILDGEKVAVPFGTVADVFVVTAADPGGSVLVALVDRDAAGVSIQEAVGTAGDPQARLLLDGCRVVGGRVLAGAAHTAYRIAVAGLCATAAGLLDGGLRLTASYIAGREQFGRPIAAFQGPAMRIADAYIDVQAVWAATWSAVWRLDTGRPADDALAIAKFWVADGGQRAVHAFQHLHGGIGVDVEYPIHRYFSQAKALEVALGGASVQLERLGASIAAAAVGAGPGAAVGTGT
ncbi:MAG TPA: acyl-CoA dehydrogenase, partial [Acidimicrobiales bacterium]|nr:acyl-CoA dehydrogenase [Acidimicrobiales bacterium]